MALQDSYTTGMDNKVNVYAGWWATQTFTPTTGYDISYVILKLYRWNTPGDITVNIKAVDGSSYPTGPALATGVTDGDTLTEDTNGEERVIIFESSYTLEASTEYAIEVSAPDASAAAAYWICDRTLPTYSAGDAKASLDSGSSWASLDPLTDFYFKTYDGIYLEPADKTYTRKAIAIAGNEVWYESSTGVLTELTAANGDIDVSVPLTAVEMMEKGFIANQTNLKVIDFVNVKIATADIGSHPPDPGTILTSDGTGNPSMIVDYITSLTGACTIYGRRTTTVTFGASENIAGTDDDGNAISFQMTAAAEVLPPHWYDFTVFGNDSSFGTLPTSAYLICLYRGRIMLAGDSNYPHQWYMSDVAKPFNWLYTTDVLTAVSGNNTTAGKIGDIVRVIIPYGDDYLVCGCAGSVYILDGDPKISGSIERLSETTGIYSWTSWCKDDSGNLYFFGNHGVYIMEGGLSKPRNISKLALPQLVDDWGAHPSTHRVVFSYDSKRRGILMLCTTISTGACTGYFYSLETEGFYPVTLPNACGVYCGFDYNADDPASRDLLVGCTDGYIRKFVDTEKNHDVGATDQAISSYFGIVQQLSEDPDKEGKLTSLTVELAGGASGGDFSDSDGCSYEYHTADDAETALEHLKDGATARESGTLAGTGRKARIRERVRAAWLALKFYNSTASETFGINKLYGIVRQVGRIK